VHPSNLRRTFRSLVPAGCEGSTRGRDCEMSVWAVISCCRLDQGGRTKKTTVSSLACRFLWAALGHRAVRGNPAFERTPLPMVPAGLIARCHPGGKMTFGFARYLSRRKLKLKLVRVAGKERWRRERSVRPTVFFAHAQPTNKFERAHTHTTNTVTPAIWLRPAQHTSGDEGRGRAGTETGGPVPPVLCGQGAQDCRGKMVPKRTGEVEARPDSCDAHSIATSLQYLLSATPSRLLPQRETLG